MLFCAGPCTQGPGMIVSNELKEPVRSHHDIERDNAKYLKKASKFYEGLSKRATDSGHTIDILVGCYDQVGFLEMKSCVTKTGGFVVLSDSFNTSIFKQSFQRLFTQKDGSLVMGFNANIDVFTSKELKVCGAIGPCTSNNKKTQYVAETEIGVGGTSSWRMCGIFPTTTLGLYFEVVNQQNQPNQSNQRGVIQFLTHYQHASGQYRLRVTTLSRKFEFYLFI